MILWGWGKRTVKHFGADPAWQCPSLPAHGLVQRGDHQNVVHAVLYPRDPVPRCAT